MKKITFSIFFLSLSIMMFGQERNSLVSESVVSPDGVIRCASDAYNREQLNKYPNMMGSDQYESNLNDKIRELSNSSHRGGTIRLPVVVHVIHNGEAIGSGTNISDAQVLSQIQVLNDDYRKVAGSRGDGEGVDTLIEFYLAQEDPDCNPTSGINRVLRSSIPNNGASIDGDIKPKTIWDSSRYLNMWTINLGGGLLGYAQFPGGDPMTDGVVMGYQYFGSNDDPNVTLGGSFNLGRTTTHEVGHYLGLLHTFQGGCGAQGDLVDDTPPEAQPYYGCTDTPPDTCAGGDDDPIENYMDYSDDICMNMFTAGQNVRMQAVLNGPRSALATSTVPETPLADVNNDGSIKIWCFDEICGETIATLKVGNNGTNMLTSATINYNVNGGGNQVYNWSGNLAQGEVEFVDLPSITGTGGTDTFNVSISLANTDQRTCNDDDSDTFQSSAVNSFGTTQVHLTIIGDDYSGVDNSWEFKDSNGTVLYSGAVGSIPNNTTYNESFDVSPNECYTFTIDDAYGDGLCCNEGNGSYELLTDDDSVIINGGDFGSTESTALQVETLSVGEFFIDNTISIYPNPVNEEFSIKLGNSNELPDSFEIYSILGQNMVKTTVTSNADLTVNANSFSNGVYFIKINKGDASKTLRFIKR